jgi:hypothetical protein
MGVAIIEILKPGFLICDLLFWSGANYEVLGQELQSAGASFVVFRLSLNNTIRISAVQR